MTSPNTPEPEPGKLPRSQTERARWATRRMTVKSGKNKRMSILNRRHQKNGSNEKNQITEGGDNAGDASTAAEGDIAQLEEEEEKDDRTLWFNLPLPDEQKDEEGHPLRIYARNKIRTAKYTPLSFIPKNLWFQFHNVANIFFLFIVILVFFPIFGGIDPGLNSVPLIVIVVVTAVKDAYEDSRRTILDIELNNASLHRLVSWNNVNVQDDNVSTWRKIKKATSRFFGGLWHAITTLWSKKARNERAERKANLANPEDEARPSGETHRTRRSVRESLASPFHHEDRRASYLSAHTAHEDIQMTPVHSPATPHITIELPDEDDAKRATALQTLKGDLINHDRPTSGARFKKDTWKSLNVGDFVRIYKDDDLPADVIVLSTSDADGACYVETKNLDGETNLKVRSALRCGRNLRHARDCERAEFWIESEGPQANLYKYNGAIKWMQELPGFEHEGPQEMLEPITIDNMLLRGCNLRNTDWILGVVVFTGHDTKIMRNQGETPSKRPRIARELNFNVLCNLTVLFVICLLSAIINGVAWAKTDASLYFFEYGSIGGSPGLSGFITFWAAIIVFQNLIPISLYITLEVVRTLQAIFIYSDVEMYYAPIDQPCIPKTWNISDDVGQIEYIFSDKTGTLTQNVMEFKKATVNGHPYGEAYTEAQAGMQKRQGIDVEAEGEKIRAEIAEAKVHSLAGLRKIHDSPFLHDEDLTFIAPDFVADMAGESGQEQQEANQNFMLVLALCHTVMAERTFDNPPKMSFSAQSPDEEALVATARDMGFVVLGNSDNGINLMVQGEERHYQILNTIEFNSSRKRMSSIVKMPDGRIMLFCKGADSVIYARLKRGEQKELRQATAEHLELFAREGLRTLCIAQKEISETEYRAWKKEHDAAAAAIEHREEKMEAAAELIEQDLFLLGGTAIEDRLQDGVPDTIALLGEAGIKLWVLTGDKVETAINIGFSCNLLNNDMELIHLKVEADESSPEIDEEPLLQSVDEELTRHLATFNLTGSDEELKAAKKDHEPPAPTHGLVIDGFTLKWALNERNKQKFLLLCKQCKSVLCCRVSPAQKAAVVAMVKNGLDIMSLSIGDGANDVAMIQEADVGVGIAGVEGRQAAMSSDYAIAQFRFLQRLVLVHGRWSYRRMSECIANFFYKNMVWVWSIFWFEIYCDFDITYIFEFTYIIMFNLFFTAFPVGLMGVLDQDVSDKVSLAVPQLYRRGIERLEWTNTKFWLYMFDGVYQSVMVFYIPYLMVQSGNPITDNGLDMQERFRLGAYIAHPAVLVINSYILMNTYRWDWIMLLVTVISNLFVFFWTGVYTSFESAGTFAGAAREIYSQPSFWACFAITPVMCLFPRFIIKALQKVYWPYDIDIIREQEQMGKFDYLKTPLEDNDKSENHKAKSANSGSSDSTGRGKHTAAAPSMDSDLRPFAAYAPSTATRTTHNQRSQNGSDSTNFTGPRLSLDVPMPMRPSVDRAGPSFQRMRASMDAMRPSFEEVTTNANRLSKIESTRSGNHRFSRLRGLSLSKSNPNP